MTILRRFLLDEKAAAATEYAIMIALILMVVVAAVTNVGNQFNASFNATSTKL